MLLRPDDRGVLAIGQASHAWLSGQLARAWGTERFGAVEPWAEVCLAADQHDVGMAAWDLDPTFNEATGLPHSFMEMPLQLHLDLWLAGPPKLLSQSAYAAVLVSMHGWRLYKRRDLEGRPAHEARAITAFLQEQRAFQDGIIALLQQDEFAAPWVAPDRLECNSLLIWTWDYLSLALCLDWAPATAKGAPTAEGPVDLELDKDPNGELTLDPWPFQADSVRVRCEGRRLPERLADETAMREALAQAPLETLELGLTRSA